MVLEKNRIVLLVNQTNLIKVFLSSNGSHHVKNKKKSKNQKERKERKKEEKWKAPKKKGKAPTISIL